MMYKLNPIPLALALLALPAVTFAQERPEAGQIQQQSQPRELAPLTPSVELDLDAGVLTAAEVGGARVQLSAIHLQGNQVFSAEKLLALLGDYQGQQYDLAGLQGLANQISHFYRNQGYVFASALLPAQDLASGELKIHVIEGRYGKVNTLGDLAAATQRFVSPLQPGDVIESSLLERQLMIMGDLPGVVVVPVMRPGEQLGTGNLDVQVSETQRITGRISADNHGSRFSGAYRASGVIKANRLLTMGDQLSFSWLYSSEETWLGGLQYSLPVGSSGLMANAGYAHTDYTLGKGFEGYKGTAAVSSVGLSYPVIRSQQANLSVQATYQYKDLDDKGLSGFKKATASHSLPLQLSFDKRDAFAGGGITYGQFIVTPGQLDIEQFGAAKDQNFTKLNLQVVRLQSLAERLTLVTKLDTQWTGKKDLDGSESFSLGGPQAVRAYPVSEGSASRGLVVQMEMRYATAYGLTPYTFVDAGQTARGDVDGSKRRISGAGLGSSYAWKTLQLDANLAWSLSGGDSQADTKGNDPRFWLSAKYSF